MKYQRLALCLALTACSSSPSGDPKGKVSKDAAATPQVDAAPTPKVTAAQVGAILPQTVGLPVVMGSLDFSKRRAQIEAEIPGLKGEGRMALPGAPGVELRVGYFKADEALRYAQIVLPRAQASAVESRWGKGISVRAGGGRTTTWWVAEDQKTQAVLTDSGGETVRLEVWPCLGWAQLLGAERGRLGFVGQPLLGRSADAVLAAAELRPRKRKGGRIELRLAPTPLLTRATVITLGVTEGVVSEVSFVLNLGKDPKALEAVEAVLSKKLGEPSSTDKTSRQWAGAPHVKITRVPRIDQLAVTLTPGG